MAVGIERLTVELTHEQLQRELDATRLAVVSLLAVMTDEQFRGVETALLSVAAMSEISRAALEELRTATGANGSPARKTRRRRRALDCSFTLSSSGGAASPVFALSARLVSAGGSCPILGPGRPIQALQSGMFCRATIRARVPGDALVANTDDEDLGRMMRICVVSREIRVLSA